MFRSWSSTPFQMTMAILVNNVEWEITILFLFVCQETMSDAYPTTPLAFTAEKPTKLREWIKNTHKKNIYLRNRFWAFLPADWVVVSVLSLTSFTVVLFLSYSLLPPPPPLPPPHASIIYFFFVTAWIFCFSGRKHMMHLLSVQFPLDLTSVLFISVYWFQIELLKSPAGTWRLSRRFSLLNDVKPCLIIFNCEKMRLLE